MVLLAHLPLQGDLSAVNYSPTEQNGVHPIDGSPYSFTTSKGGNETFVAINDLAGGSHERLSGIKALKLELTSGFKRYIQSDPGSVDSHAVDGNFRRPGS